MNPSLESPAALLLAVTLPAVLLLWMLRPRRPRLRIPSLMLWPGSPAERQSARPWQRLRNHPLLWLQLAIAALLVAAAARPFLPGDAAGRHLVVFLDASGSMAASEGRSTRFDAAREAVLDQARGLAPGQELTIIRLDEQPRVLVAGARGVSQVEAALAEQAPSSGVPDVAGSLALATGLTTGPAEWLFVGDGGLPLPAGARRPAGTSMRFLPVGGPAGNVAVTALAARRGDGQTTLQAALRNAGTVPAEGSLQLLAEGQLVSAQRWRLEPGGEGFLTWSHLPLGPRWYEARIAGLEGSANALAADDRAWVAVDAPSEPEVLLVTPGSSFLEQLLRSHGGMRAFRSSPSDWAGLVAQGQGYPLTILDRVLPDPVPRGNLLVVGPPVGEEFRPTRVWPKADHPLMRHVDWSEVRVGTARKLPGMLDLSSPHPDPLPGGEGGNGGSLPGGEGGNGGSLPEGEGEPRGGEGGTAGGWQTVIDSDGGPLLVVREENGRRQALLAFDLGKSDLPLRPAFPVLMANLLEWMLPGSGAGSITPLPGGSFLVDPLPLAQQLWVEGSDGSRLELAPPWPPLPFRPPSPGLYRVAQAWQGGQEEALLVAGGYHQEEADLTPRVLELPAADGALTAGARGTLALWPWLAAVLLLVSLLEWWVDARGR